MTSINQPEFGKWRKLIWPIYNHELKKILPMLFMFFFISFNYTILRDTKDTIIVTSKAGAAALPFLKGFVVLPMAIIVVLIYSKLSNMLNREALFYTTIVPFIIFFGLFAYVLYPNRDLIHFHQSADKLQVYFDTHYLWGKTIADRFPGVVDSFRNWSFSLFYVLAELWGSVALSLLFWGFANQITRVYEAKRYYGLFGLGANIALLVSGPTIIHFSNLRKSLPPEVDAWGVTLNWLMSFVVVAGFLVIFFYWWINRYVLTDPLFYSKDEQMAGKKKKPKLSLTEGLITIAKSKYLLCIALLVICYGMTINLIEVPWKNMLKQQFTNPNDYSAFMGLYSTITGAVTVILILFVGHNVIRVLGWTIAALTTPIILGITGLGFFAFVLFKDQLGGFVSAMGTTPLMLACIFGAAQGILTKATKYSIFDPTKEMTYIPLDEDFKVKGKAAVDVVGARFGKSSGAYLNTGLIALLGGIQNLALSNALIVVIGIVIWIIAAISLGHQFKQKQIETGHKL